MTRSNSLRKVSPVLTDPAVPAAVSVLLGGLLVLAAENIGTPAELEQEWMPLVHAGTALLMAGVTTALAAARPGARTCPRTHSHTRAGAGRDRWRLACGAVLSCVIGLWITAAHVESYRPPTGALMGSTVREVRGVCLTDLRPASASSRVIPVELTEVQSKSGWKGSAGGRSYLIWSGPEYLATVDNVHTLVPNRGDIIQATADFPTPGQSVVWAQGTAIRVAPATGFLPRVRRQAREFVRRRLARLPTDTYTMALGLLLGTRAEMASEDTDAVRAAGASHVIALSGMHLGVLALLISKVTSRMGMPRLRRLCIALSLLGYVWIAGWIPSLVRALVLACLALVAMDRDRSLPPAVLLSRCVVVMAVVAPGMVWALGFQLSLWALVGLFFLSPRLVELFSAVLPQPIAAYIGVTFGAMVTTAPVSLMVFGTAYPVGLVSAGLLALVAVGLMWGGLLFIVLATVPGIGSLLAAGLTVVVRAFRDLSAAFAVVPGVDLGEANGLISLAGWCTLLAAGVGLAVLVSRRQQRAFRLFLESHGKPQFNF